MNRTLIVGGGASGLLVAMQLARQAKRQIKVDISEPRSILGQGLAYSTADQEHLLNVPAGRMSAFPDEPDHFVNWLGQDKDFFASRKIYGRYLLESFVELQVEKNLAVFEHRPLVVVSLSRVQERWVAEFSDATRKEYDKVVLALGHGKPMEISSFESIHSHTSFILDPWRDFIAETPGLMVAIGTGLTFIDHALSHLRSNPNNTVIGVSRNGLLPKTHLPKRAQPLAVPAAVKGSPQEVRAFIESAEDWRAAQDGVRHELPEIWHSWSESQKSEFFQKNLRWWNVHRHRMSPEIDEQLQSYIASGRLKVIGDEVVGFESKGKEIEVELLKNGTLIANRIINCLGYNSWGQGSLIESLINNGYAKAGPLEMGIQTNFPEYQVVSKEGLSTPNLFALGPVLLGERFETTAIPELKEQAEAVAKAVIG